MGILVQALGTAALVKLTALEITVAKSEELRILIQSINYSPQGNDPNVENRNFQLTLSKVCFCVKLILWCFFVALKNNTLSKTIIHKHTLDILHLHALKH